MSYGKRNKSAVIATEGTLSSREKVHPTFLLILPLLMSHSEKFSPRRSAPYTSRRPSASSQSLSPLMGYMDNRYVAHKLFGCVVYALLVHACSRLSHFTPPSPSSLSTPQRAIQLDAADTLARLANVFARIGFPSPIHSRRRPRFCMLRLVCSSVLDISSTPTMAAISSCFNAVLNALQGETDFSSSTFHHFLNRAINESATGPYAPAGDFLQVPYQPAPMIASPICPSLKTTDNGTSYQGSYPPGQLGADSSSMQPRRCDDCGATQTAQWYGARSLIYYTCIVAWASFADSAPQRGAWLPS